MGHNRRKHETEPTAWEKFLAFMILWVVVVAFGVALALGFLDLKNKMLGL